MNSALVADGGDAKRQFDAQAAGKSSVVGADQNGFRNAPMTSVTFYLIASELVSRACIPGVLSKDFNPDGLNRINLCEMCQSGGSDKCQRDNKEFYYGDSGAFRCLIESGDIAFVRHTTVHADTATRVQNYEV
ncbi:unnamed protein product [Protopolystoma xenopodis]|uniref:Transferrin-like domain-containing protein n=1 Tax=Protopolystoma xenopodis TaxID=117903 RepID=A0A3S5B9H8_9PLAT|nr:unnamed protein product [Protopolystoma xenopodis]